jgi:membrane protease YdiL (CAAX protease family)
MSVKKLSKSKKPGLFQEELNHTKVSFTLSIIAPSIMLVLGLLHYSNLGFEGNWGKFALTQSIWGFLGFFGSQIIKQEKLIPQRFKEFNINTGIYSVSVLAAAMLTQIITQYVFTISTTEQALYYVFSSVCEELFFRLFLINIFLQFSEKLNIKIIAVITESALFAAVHQNYYSNPGMLLGVFLGGVVFGIAYIWKRDITICILAHFFLNIIATANWLVTLSAQISYNAVAAIIIMITIIILMILVIRTLKKTSYEQWQIILLESCLCLLIIGLLTYTAFQFDLKISFIGP